MGRRKQKGRNARRKNIRRVTFGAMTVALGVVIMALGSIFESLDLTMACIASALIPVVLIEYGTATSLTVFFCTGVLTMLLPGKTVGLCYLLFFGYYPVVKAIFERKLPKILSYVCKFLLGNVAVGLWYFLAWKFFTPGVSADGPWWFLAFALLFEVVLFLYDRLMTRGISLYLNLWRPKVFYRFFDGNDS